MAFLYLFYFLINYHKGNKIMKLFVTSLCSVLTLCSTLLFATSTQESEKQAPTYKFVGRHLMASYKGCNNQMLTNIPGLKRAMLEAVNASGAHLLDSCEYVFSGDGLTLVMLLSESHASIHTYPEYNSCFVDIFTCGTKCSQEKFDESFRKYLQPQEVICQIVDRN